MAHLCELLEQPLAASSSMIGSDYSYDFPPPPPIPEMSSPNMDNSQRSAEEEEEEKAPAATANDPLPSVRPRRKKLRSEVWQFFYHAYKLQADGTQVR